MTIIQCCVIHENLERFDSLAEYSQIAQPTYHWVQDFLNQNFTV